MKAQAMPRATSMAKTMMTRISPKEGPCGVACGSRSFIGEVTFLSLRSSAAWQAARGEDAMNSVEFNRQRQQHKPAEPVSNPAEARQQLKLPGGGTPERRSEP